MSKFVIAIGGTGMRCLESFVHLCAIGMFDNEEINILTLDTDQTNGNKGRVEQLIDLYQKVKSEKPDMIDGGSPNANTFFSAKINLYRFFTDYNATERKTFQNLSQMNSGTTEQKEDNRELSELMLDDGVRNFALDHGYRAQTHLGSMLMYNGIVEAARSVAADKSKAKSQDKELAAFATKLAQDASNAMVFVFGSVFGGTGASSIPVIPVALTEAVRIVSGGSQSLDLKVVKFGATLLTKYFTFKAPDKSQKEKEKVIADASNFALNSQAALQFYQADPTVKSCYKRLYHIGWPINSIDFTEDNPKTITGGAEQKNDCHVVELLSACAAYDFFTLSKFGNQQAQYLYRSADFSGSGFCFEGSDFVGNEKGVIFENKLGAFLSFAHIVLSVHGAALSNSHGTMGFLERFRKQDIKDYEQGITEAQANDIDEYMKWFAYDYSNGSLTRGWIYQIYKSIKPGRFIFKSSAFTENAKELRDMDPGNLFEDDKHNWDKGGVFSNRYNNYVKTLIDQRCKPKKEQNVNTTKERFLAHIYNSITIVQKFNELK